MKSLRDKKKGMFTVEFGLISVVFAILLLLVGDTVVKLSMKGQLDRLSYSMVNVLKERTQLYGKDNNTLNSSDAANLLLIAGRSLSRTNRNSFKRTDLNGTVEMLKFDSRNQASSTSINVRAGCHLSRKINQLSNLSVTTTWGRKAVLYRVTLCYETDNFAGRFFGKKFTTVQSSSLSIGR